LNGNRFDSERVSVEKKRASPTANRGTYSRQNDIDGTQFFNWDNPRTIPDLSLWVSDEDSVILPSLADSILNEPGCRGCSIS